MRKNECGGLPDIDAGEESRDVTPITSARLLFISHPR
jgi:hypothetical protein